MKRQQYRVEALDPERSPDGPFVVLSHLTNCIESVHETEAEATFTCRKLNRAWVRAHGPIKTPKVVNVKPQQYY